MKVTVPPLRGRLDAGWEGAHGIDLPVAELVTDRAATFSSLVRLRRGDAGPPDSGAAARWPATTVDRQCRTVHAC